MQIKTAAGIALLLSGACAMAASALDRDIPGSNGTGFAAIGASMNNGVSFVPSGAYNAQAPSLGAGSFTGIGESYSRSAIVPASLDSVTPIQAAASPSPTVAVETDKSRNLRHAYQTFTYSPAARHRTEMIYDSYIAFLNQRAREPVAPRYDVATIRQERARRTTSQNKHNNTRRAYEI